MHIELEVRHQSVLQSGGRGLVAVALGCFPLTNNVGSVAKLKTQDAL